MAAAAPPQTEQTPTRLFIWHQECLLVDVCVRLKKINRSCLVHMLSINVSTGTRMREGQVLHCEQTSQQQLDPALFTSGQARPSWGRARCSGFLKMALIVLYMYYCVILEVRRFYQCASCLSIRQLLHPGGRWRKHLLHRSAGRWSRILAESWTRWEERRTAVVEQK